MRTLHRLLPVALFAGACFPTQALAWKHLEFAWLPEDMPIPYVVQEECEASVPAEYCNEMIEAVYADWAAVPCVDISHEYVGPYMGNSLGNMTTFDLGDRHNHWSFDDPDGELDLGVIAANLTQRFGLAFQLFGTNYQHADNSDTCFNDNIDFGTQEEIDAGQCAGQTNMRGTALHETGHSLGLGHSCDDGELCNDPDLLGAVMYYTGDGCDPLHLPQLDDIQGITPLYGPAAKFSCSHKVEDTELSLGVVPFELKCTVESRDFLPDVTNALWSFGDGATAEGVQASHVYEEPGNYTVRVEVQGDSDGCDDEGWTAEFRKVGYVRACGIPDVAFGVEHIDGRQYQMLNQTDVSVYGCIQDIVWNVFKGGNNSGEPIEGMTVKAWEPIFDFPEDGEYTVVANIGGAAGTGAAKLTFDVKNRRGTGRSCNTAGGPAGVGFLVLALGLLGIRRRR